MLHSFTTDRPPLQRRENTMTTKPPRDTRMRNRIFFITVAVAIALGLWLSR